MDLGQLAEQLTSVFGFPVLAETPICCEEMPIDGRLGTGAGQTDRGTICLGAGRLYVNANSRESPCWCEVQGLAVHVEEDSERTPCTEKPTATTGSPPVN
jgi:hypothetical protein